MRGETQENLERLITVKMDPSTFSAPPRQNMRKQQERVRGRQNPGKSSQIDLRALASCPDFTTICVI